MQISANNLLALQQTQVARPRAEIKPPQPEKFETLFEKPAATTQASPTQSTQPSATASAQPSAPAQMGSQLDITV